MSGAVVISQLGGPEVLEWVEKDPGEVGPDEVRVRHTAVGLNFIDVYHRTGLYPQELPFTPGVEGAGIVEAVGSEVDDLEVIGQAHTADVRDLQAVVTVMNQPAQRLRAFAGQHAVPSDELAMVEGPRRREPVFLVPALARSRHVRAADIPPHTRSRSVEVPKRAQLERMIGRGALEFDPRVIGHAQ